MISQGTFDYCVVGGGVAGMTVARTLAMRGERVLITERDLCGAGASTAAAGMLAPLVEARLSERNLVEFGREALARYESLLRPLERESGIDCDYRTEGTLAVAVDRDHLVWLDHFLEEQQALGLDVERLSSYECRRLEPMLSPGVPGGVRSPHDRQINNRRLLRALRAWLEQSERVTVVEGCGPLLLEDTGGALVLRGADGVLARAERYIVATGAWNDVLRGIDPHLARALMPVKGQVLRLDQTHFPVIGRVIRSPEMYMAPKSDGSVVLGATSEDRGFDPHVTAGAVFELLRAAWEAVPAVVELPLVETRVGYRPATLDHLPVLGLTRDARVAVAGGYYRHGILFGLLAAEILVDHLVEGSSSPWLDIFSPSRFNTDGADDHTARERNSTLQHGTHGA